MTRRERLEARLEKRQEWAEARKRDASARFEAAHEVTKDIPMGQPILVGHHSERHHRADLARSDGHMRKAVESSDMAKHHEQCATGIERQLETTIFSDDPDAIEAIQAKIEGLEAERETNNSVNAIVRKKPKNQATPEKVAELVGMGMSERTAQSLFEPDFCGRFGIASYVNQNLGGNITRLRKRIEEITVRNQRTQAAEESGGVVIERGNGDYCRVTFAEKPDRDILNALRDAGFYWGSGSWCGPTAKLPECVTDL